MGAGIAQVAAQAGYAVMLVDAADAWLDRGLESITGNLDRLVARDRLTIQERDAVLARIEGSIEIDHMADCGLVIEAVTESLDTKCEVLRQVAEFVDTGTLIASNTSSISKRSSSAN